MIEQGAVIVNVDVDHGLTLSVLHESFLGWTRSCQTSYPVCEKVLYVLCCHKVVNKHRKNADLYLYR